jgi:nicotinate-nucleotide adenylyltransferase
VTPAPERLGILGGTFDPVHVGHLVAATEARHQLALDRVLLVVAADPWQKHGDVTAGAADRYDMVAAACEGVDGLEPSRIEIDRGGPSYTIDTVRALAAPSRSLFLVVGVDVVRQIDTWRNVEALPSAVTLAVVSRADEHDEPPRLDGWNVVPVTMPRLDVSSTDIRRRLRDGAPVDFLVPAGAVRVMRDRRLYTPAR